MERLKRALILLMLFTIFSHASMYENAEDGLTDNWRIIDNTPVASISNVESNGSKVISLNGEGRKNLFILGGKNNESQKWDNQSESKTFKWKMKFDSRYYVYIYIETSSGAVQRIRYSSSLDHKIDHSELRISLGRESDDGAWVEVERDIEADLKTLLPDDSIIAVNGFMVQGSGMVDDISYGEIDNDDGGDDGGGDNGNSDSTIYENGEAINDWHLYPSGQISDELVSQDGVVAFQQRGKYILGGTDYTNGWGNETQKNISWRMKFDRRYYIYVYVTTSSGEIDFIRYSSSNDHEVNHSHIRMPLGRESDDGAWVEVSRDLNDDLHSLRPNDTILAVHGIMVYATSDAGMIDDIILSGEGSDDSDTVKPVITLVGDATINLTVGDSYSDAGATANDDRDGNITSNIITVDPVDTSVAGTYVVTYDVNDSANNQADQVTRTVILTTIQDFCLTRAELEVMIAHNDDVTDVNTSCITDMSDLFKNNVAFDQNISNWDVSNVTNMNKMFEGAISFNHSLNDWNISNVRNVEWMFQEAIAYNQPLNNWDVSQLTSLNGMFAGTIAFNQPLNDWDVSNVTSTTQMFEAAIGFDQPLNDWNVSNVFSMHNMFFYAISFNQPLNDWDTSHVIWMNQMFMYTPAFNQDIHMWNISSVVKHDNFALESGLEDRYNPFYVPSPAELAQAKIEAYANDNTNPNPTLQDYIDVGVTGVTAGNLEAVNDAVANASSEDVDTVAELDAMVLEINTPTITDSTLVGRITAITGATLSGVSIKVLKNGMLQTPTATSDATGVFDINLTANTKYTLSFSKDGFANQIKRVKTPLVGERLHLDISMIQRASHQAIPQDGTLRGADGARIVVENLIFHDTQGNEVTAQDGINLTITPVDVSSPVGLATFPGDFSGVPQGDDDPSPIISYGTVEYQFTRASDGAVLQLAANNPIAPSIFIPLYTQTHPDGTAIELGDTIPLWSLDEETGIWTQEGVGTVEASTDSPSGFVLRATVSHFTWWNADVPMSEKATAIVTVNTPSSGTALIKARSGGNFAWALNNSDAVATVGSPISLEIPSDVEVCFWAEVDTNIGMLITKETCVTVDSASAVIVNLSIASDDLSITASPSKNISTYVNLAPKEIKLLPQTLESEVSYTVSSGTLPAGVSLITINDTTAVIAGVPSEVGTFNFDIMGTDVEGNEDTVSLSYTVLERSQLPVLDTGFINDDGSFIHYETAGIRIYDFGSPMNINVANIGGAVTSWTISVDPNQMVPVGEIVINEEGYFLYDTDISVPVSEFTVNIDEVTGILTVIWPMSYIENVAYRLDFEALQVEVTATNAHGSATRILDIVKPNGNPALDHEHDEGTVGCEDRTYGDVEAELGFSRDEVLNLENELRDLEEHSERAIEIQSEISQLENRIGQLEDMLHNCFEGE